MTVGDGHACALLESGRVECWGGNSSGQADPPAGRFSAVSAGASHTCALTESGEAECWGSREFGAADAPSGSFRDVSAGAVGSCGLRESGELECWGYTFDRQAQPPADERIELGWLPHGLALDGWRGVARRSVLGSARYPRQARV